MRCIYRDMNVILSDESMTHIRCLKEMGYTEGDAYAAPTAPENREYLDYMLSVAREGTMQEGLVSLMACGSAIITSRFTPSRRRTGAARRKTTTLPAGSTITAPPATKESMTAPTRCASVSSKTWAQPKRRA